MPRRPSSRRIPAADSRLNHAHHLVTEAMVRRERASVPFTLCYVDPKAPELVVGYDPRAGSGEAVTDCLRTVVAADVPTRVTPCFVTRHANKQAHHRPVLGGVVITATAVAGVGSLGIALEHSAERGIVTAGHVVRAIGTAVYQPRQSGQNDWKIGVATRVSNYAKAANSDSAFVKLEPGVDATQWRVWKSGASQYTVTGVGPAEVEDEVFMQGASTAATERSGTVCSSDATVKFADAGILTHQYLANYLTQVGDSGAPVYTKQADPDVTLLGINVGGTAAKYVTAGAPAADCQPNKNNEYAIISPWASVIQDLFGD